MRILRLSVIGCFLLIWAGASCARDYRIKPHQRVVGKISLYTVKKGETLEQIAKSEDMGYDEIVHANPHVSEHPLQAGMVLVMPTQFVLPEVAHRGVVINTAEMRLYYFSSPHHVRTFPVGIGREGWATPEGFMKIIQKRKSPTWYVPPTLRKERAKEGVMLPKVMPPGPDNPLGQHAIRLSRPNYLIHGTNEPEGVGRRSSAGCLRMYADDIAYLYDKVKVGTPVRILNHPIKVARVKQQLLLESHTPLIESPDDKNLGEAAKLFKEPTLEEAIAEVREHATAKQAANLDLPVVKQVLRESMGVPIPIGTVQR